MKYRWATLFIFAYLLNFLWEEWHSQFYVHFKTGPITHWILAYAAFVDACLITLLGLTAARFKNIRHRYAVMVLGGLFFSLVLEWRALLTNRWAYADSMLIVPLLQTGLTPTIQLALLGSLAYWLAFKLVK